MGSAQILKVQMPLFGAADALIYNEDRSIYAMLPLQDAPELVEYMGDSLKRYIVGAIVDGKLEINGNAPWQEW